MADEHTLPVVKVDVLDVGSQPALSATSDVPVVETQPDSQAAFDGQKSGVKDPAAPSDEGKKPEESADPDDDTEEQPGEPSAKKKPPKGVQKALDRLTREREEWRERAQASDRKLADALKLIDERLPKPAEKAEPKREDFEDPEAYIEAKAAWKADQDTEARLRKRDQEQLDAAVQAEHQKIVNTYKDRLTQVSQELPDFDEVGSREDVQVPLECVHAILMHEQGPRIQYYLGQHPDEAKALYELNPIQRVGRIHEIGLQVKPQPKPISKAPEPIKPLGSRESAKKDPADMSMDEYAAYAKEREANARKARSRT